MKYVKILSLAAMALAALMAMAGTASAAFLTSSNGVTPTIEASSSHVTLTSVFGGFGAITCKKSGVKGTVENHGTGQTIIGKITSLTFTECTGGTPTDPVAKPGSLELHNLAGTSDGTLTSLGAEVIIHETAFGTCKFTTPESGRHIGRLTGSNTTGGKAVLDIENAKIDSACGTGTWEGKYTVNVPATLNVDA